MIIARNHQSDGKPNMLAAEPPVPCPVNVSGDVPLVVSGNPAADVAELLLPCVGLGVTVIFSGFPPVDGATVGSLSPNGSNTCAL